MENNKLPIIWRKKGSKKTDPCPFCGEKHLHGTDEGHRLTHCMMKMSRGKEVQPPKSVLIDGVEYKREFGYILKEY